MHFKHNYKKENNDISIVMSSSHADSVLWIHNKSWANLRDLNSLSSATAQAGGFK